MSLGRVHSSVATLAAWESHLRFKTQLCHYFTNSGFCSRGQWCKFAHGVGQLRVGLEGAGSGEEGGVEAFLKGIRSQEEVGGGEAAVVEVVKHNT